ncbi:MAG: cupin domain-containing protein [Thermomicrobiales bacterium]|nr:cupin domain-containing protein [Thermomicrobiales bacterium]
MTASLLGSFSIDEEIARFPPGDTAAGRRAETLIKTDGLRVVLVTMRTGISLHEHVAPGPITIHALRGRFAVTYDDQQRELGPGDIVALAPGVRHAVATIEEGAFLLTIGWSPNERGG